MPHVSLKERFKKLNIEVELGFTAEQTADEVQRCLNCDVQTVFSAKLCIECDACIDICPVDCLTITHNGDEADLRARLKAPAKNLTQPSQCQATYARIDLHPQQRFRHQDRHVEWHLLGERQQPADEVHLPQRYSGDGKELLPLQHPGPAYMVRDPRDAGRLCGPLR